MAEETKAGSDTVEPTDIVFLCPKCGKSLAIDRQGAGYVVNCPDCGSEMQVPETAGLQATSGGEVGDLAATVQDLRERTERLRSLDRRRFEEISAEIGLVQAALDRIVGILQDALAPGEDSSEER